jgi:hypothetical protein
MLNTFLAKKAPHRCKGLYTINKQILVNSSLAGRSTYWGRTYHQHRPYIFDETQHTVSSFVMVTANFGVIDIVIH